jgi:hypothetical protein
MALSCAKVMTVPLAGSDFCTPLTQLKARALGCTVATAIKLSLCARKLHFR